MKQNYFPLLLLTIAMILSSGLSAQTDCDPNGDGNPGDLNDGRGQGTGGSNNPGDLAWDLLLNPSGNCFYISTQGDLTRRCVNRDITPAGSTNQQIQGVRIAVIDSGVRPSSPGRLNESTLISYKVSSSGTVTRGVAHPHPHGTYSAAVISTMLKNQNHAHTFYDYQVLDGNLRTSLDAVVAAIDHAVWNRVNLISLSIGFLPTDCDNIDWKSPSSPLFAAIDRARRSGVVVITSAGNDGNDLELAPQYPAAYENLENLVSVGALNCEMSDRTSFSNYGANIVDVFTLGTYIKIRYGYCIFDIHGTSFATSIVAGKAAVHFAMGSRANEVLCLLRSQTEPFPGNQLAIYGIVDVNGNNGNAKCGLREGSLGKKKSLEKQDMPSLEISPNPFRDQLRVSLGNEGEAATISLLDGRGRKILTQHTNQSDLTLDLGHLAAGVYWLVVRDINGSTTRTVVKK